MTKDHQTPAERRVIEQMRQMWQIDALVEQIKADREAGTPGPWRDRYLPQHMNRITADEGQITICDIALWQVDYYGQQANAHRIARVPDMESRILADAEVIKAAEETDKWAGNLLSRKANPKTGGRMILEVDLLRLEESLAAFRQALQGRAKKGGE